jgi:hypothetical protein
MPTRSEILFFIYKIYNTIKNSGSRLLDREINFKTHVIDVRPIRTLVFLVKK